MPLTSEIAKLISPKAVILFLSLLFSPALSCAAEVNILIVGSEKSSSDSGVLRGKATAFSPAGVREELEKILNGAGLGTARVVLEERFKNRGQLACFNLVSWFYWPDPEDVETKTRWPNLRGELDIKWDYVVLIGDPYTIEFMPGIYAHGVSKVAAEIAKGKAKTVLLMPWPASDSRSSVEHYKEVVYRTGRSGDLLVAPAGLAWEAAGKPHGESHPTKDGAYLAAASIYSLIWQKSAKASSYKYNETLADTAFKTVNDIENKKEPLYTGAFSFQQPFSFFGDSNRGANPGKSPGGSSTETMLMNETQAAIQRAGGIVGGHGYRIGRDSGGPKLGKDYRLGDEKLSNKTFAYRYQTNTGDHDVHLAEIFRQDLQLADQVRHESDTFRTIPRRIIWAGLQQKDPSIKPMGGQGHLSNLAVTACGSYIYTIISGRCPVDPKPDPVTPEWLAQMEGYEAAWHMATCQVRAPGFKVMPGNVAADSKKGDYVTVQFLLPPVQPVTVMVSCSSDVAKATPETLTFTPQNYNQPQKVLIKAVADAKPGTPFQVLCKSRSQDVVYDNLTDVWPYQVNHRPVADPQALAVVAGVPIATRLTGSDENGQALTYTIVNKPSLGTLTIEGEKILYTARKDATGDDSFSFIANDSLEDSDPAVVKLTVKAKTHYDCNLLENATADIGITGWTKAEKSDGMSAREGGTNGVAFFRAEGDSNAEIYQDVDVQTYAQDLGRDKQTFKFVGHRTEEQETHFIVECLDKDKKVLDSYDSGDIEQTGKRSAGWVKAETTIKAPAQTVTIRVRLISRKTSGRSNTGSFDELSLVAIKPE